MIAICSGDILQSRAQTLTCTVNCKGVMGKGLALRFRKEFPEMYRDYVARCSRGEISLGRPYLFKPLFPPWILNFPTKGHWRAQSRLEHILSGLEHLRDNYGEWGIESIAVPALGCGLGGLKWADVGDLIYGKLSELDIPVELYLPEGVAYWSPKT